ncbi:MAG: radical SAM protein [Coriobacteriales bacterium]|jgi:hypothetical protein
MEKLNEYTFRGISIDSIDLKCLLNTKGLVMDCAVTEKLSSTYRLSSDPRNYQSLYLSDGISAALVDIGASRLPVGDDKEFRRAIDVLCSNSVEGDEAREKIGTPFVVRLVDGLPVLFGDGEFLDQISFPLQNDYYEQIAPSGTPFIEVSTLQADRWNSWAYLWPCDFALRGEPCQFCGAGLATAKAVERGEKPAGVCPVQDLAAMVEYSVRHANVCSLQITGGSSMDGNCEARYIIPYLDAIGETTGWDRLSEDILLYVTPPSDKGFLDEYISHGARRIACSVEVWDEDLASIITPGKIKYTGRKRHLECWDFLVGNYGQNVAFSNFVLGIEPFESVREGVLETAKRGVYPGGCIWSCMGNACNGISTPPGLDFYRRCKELFYDVYREYGFIPDRTPMPNDLQAEIYNYLVADDAVERGQAPIPKPS